MAAAAPDRADDHAPQIHWHDGQAAHQARWRCERLWAAPKRVQVVNDTWAADAAYKLACEGTALLWEGDFPQARHLLDALARRCDRGPRRARSGRATPTPDTPPAPAAAFHRHRAAQAQRARVLSQLLIPIEAGYHLALRRAPDVRLACEEAWGPDDGQASVVSLRELLGLIGAHEWRSKGVPVPALGPSPANRIHPHYGVFSPVRGEYVDLVKQAPLPAGADSLAMDIGTGTGVLAAVLARRGVRQVLATELQARALACARENLQRLGVQAAVTLVAADLFPPAPSPRAALVVCNPPWLPARPGSPLEAAVYDEDSRMLRGFLQGLPAHLLPGGEGWLILSDLAEHLGLRSRAQLLGWIGDAGLVVLGRLDTRPRHRKAGDTQDPLHAARAAEVTSLWRLGQAA